MKKRTISWAIYISLFLSVSLGVNAQEEGVQRKILLENFTTEKCANCPKGHETIKKALEGRNDVVWVAHHSGYYTDKYTTSYGETYLWFYGGMAFAPGIMVDRTRIAENRYQGPVDDVYEPLVTNLIESATAVPTPVKIKIYGQYDKENRWLQIQVTGELTGLGDIPDDGDTRLNIYLTEDGIKTSSQVSSPTPIYIHDHVMRESMTGTWGEKVKLSHYFVSDPFLVKIDKLWKIENMNVVAFFSNFDSKDYNNCKVYNTEAVKIENLELEIPNGISSAEQEKINAFLSGETLFISGGHCTSLRLYDVTGKVLLQTKNKNELDLSSLPSSIYFVEAIINEKKYTRKILFNK